MNKLFTVEILQHPCYDPISLTDPGNASTISYQYTDTPVTYSMIPFVVDPSQCSVTYACLSNTGSRTDLCTVDQNGGASKMTFDTATGNFNFRSVELDSPQLALASPGFEAGDYVITI